jgi:hypothetical protein
MLAPPRQVGVAGPPIGQLESPLSRDMKKRGNLERRVTAAIFVVAAGAVETAGLLLLSPSRAFPDGLANRSGRVGKFFTSHPSVEVTGRASETEYPYRMGFSVAMSRQHAVPTARATRGAFFLEFPNSAGPRSDQLAVASGR